MRIEFLVVGEGVQASKKLTDYITRCLRCCTTEIWIPFARVVRYPSIMVTTAAARRVILQANAAEHFAETGADSTSNAPACGGYEVCFYLQRCSVPCRSSAINIAQIISCLLPRYTCVPLSAHLREVYTATFALQSWKMRQHQRMDMSLNVRDSWAVCVNGLNLQV